MDTVILYNVIVLVPEHLWYGVSIYITWNGDIWSYTEHLCLQGYVYFHWNCKKGINKSKLGYIFGLAIFGT